MGKGPTWMPKFHNPNWTPKRKTGATPTDLPPIVQKDFVQKWIEVYEKNFGFKPNKIRLPGNLEVKIEYPPDHCPTEDQEQQAFVKWLTWHKIAFFAIPNGSYKSKSAAARFKRTGLQAGVPDLLICEPRGGFHGLFIEMKRTKKWKVSEDQKTWLGLLTGKGYATYVALGADQAIAKTEQYLTTPKGTKG